MTRRHFRHRRLFVLGFLALGSYRSLDSVGLRACRRGGFSSHPAALRRRNGRLRLIAAVVCLASGRLPLRRANIDHLHAVSQLLGDVLVNRTGVSSLILETHLVQEIQ
jgi:hypothetical protein